MLQAALTSTYKLDILKISVMMHTKRENICSNPVTEKLKQHFWMLIQIVNPNLFTFDLSPGFM